MKRLTPENIQQYLEQSVRAGADVFVTQAGYVEDLTKRNAKALTSLTGSVFSNMLEFARVTSFSEASELSRGFGETIREELEQLHEDNLAAWKDYRDYLKSIYTAANDSNQEPAPEKATTAKAKPKHKKAAPKARKAA